MRVACLASRSLGMSPTAILLACALAAIAARPVRAAEPGGRAPVAELDVPPCVRAGEEIELRWSALPAGADEMELLLSLDGGRSFHVRLSPELEGDTRSFRWLVPDLPADRARLLLRIGGEDGERVGALSRPFRILHAAGAPPPELAFHEGLMWTGVGTDEARPRSSLDPREPLLGHAGGRPAASLPAPVVPFGRPLTAGPSLGRPVPIARPADAGAFVPPRQAPLRI